MAVNYEQLGKAVLELVTDATGLEQGLDDAKKKSEKHLKEIGQSFSRAGKKLSLVFTAPILAAVGLAVKGAGEEERSLALLQNAIRGAGNEGKVSAEEIRSFAEGLMQVTTYTHEETEGAATMLEQLIRLDQEGLQALLPRIQNLSSAIGTDLQTAAMQVGKFIDGASDSIGRYKVPVEEGATASERLARAVGWMDEKFPGAAEAAAQGSGKLTMLKNSLGELADSFGVVMMPTVTKLVDGLKSILDWFANLDEGTKQAIITIGLVVAAVGPLLMIGGQLITGISSLINIINTVGGVMSWASAGPIGLIILAVAALAFGVYELIKNWDTVSAFFVDLWGKIKAAFDMGIAAITGVFTGAATAIVNTVKSIYDGVYGWLVSRFQAVVDGIRGAIDSVTGFFKDLYNKVVGKSIVPDLVNGIIAEFGRMGQGVKGIADTMANALVNTISGGMEAVGEAIVNGGDAWAAFKEAAKNAIADVLMAIGKELLIWGAKAMIPMLGLFNPAGGALAIAGSIAAFVAAGAIRALAGGGWITEPVVGMGLNTGTPYAIAENEPEYVGRRGSATSEIEIQAPLIIQIDATPVYRGMLKATRGRIALIDERAVVG